MKFAFYKNGRKYTVNNAMVFELDKSVTNNFLISSTRGTVVEEDIKNDHELMREVQEGIGWNNVVVN